MPWKRGAGLEESTWEQEPESSQPLLIQSVVIFVLVGGGVVFGFGFGFLAALWHWSSWARGQFPVAVLTYTIAAGSLTHCAKQGIEPLSQCSRDITDPVAP